MFAPLRAAYSAGVAEVVAGALNVESGVSDAAHSPAAVLHAGHGAADAQTELRRLHLLAQAVLAQSKRRAEEELAFVVELRRGVIAGCTVAIHPIVVSGRESRRRAKESEMAKGLRVHRFGALAGSALEIAIMGGECQVLAVHVGDEVRNSDSGLEG
jgi:hypothetical protein